MRALVRLATLDGARAAVDVVLSSWADGEPPEGGDQRNGHHPPDDPAHRIAQESAAYLPVKVVDRAVVVDLHHTAGADFATGIQRVTREASRRWVQAADPVLVGWRTDLSAMRLLSPDEQTRALNGGPAVDPPEVDTLVVPWRSTYILRSWRPRSPAPTGSSPWRLAWPPHST